MTPWLLPLGLGAAASLTTLLGGLLALRLAGRLSLLLAITAGVVLGVAFFDLLPEALELGSSSYADRTILAWAALGFAAYLLLARLLASGQGTARWQTHLGPASLTLHSFLDGVAMGLAFQIAPEVGWAVALAVLAHDLADGVNIVGLGLAASKHHPVYRWLLANGAAPLAGVLLVLVIDLDNWLLAPLMAAFAGVFLYIGASELVPRSLTRDGRLPATLSLLAGLALMLAVAIVGE